MNTELEIIDIRTQAYEGQPEPNSLPSNFSLGGDFSWQPDAEPGPAVVNHHQASTGLVDPGQQPSDVLAVRQTRRRQINRVGALEPGNCSAQTLAQRLAYARLTRGLKQESVAAKVRLMPKSGLAQGEVRRLSRAAYAMYETGSTEPSLAVIEEIAKALSTSSAWLAFGTGAAPHKRKARARPCNCRLRYQPIDSAEVPSGSIARTNRSL